MKMCLKVGWDSRTVLIIESCRWLEKWKSNQDKSVQCCNRDRISLTQKNCSFTFKQFFSSSINYSLGIMIYMFQCKNKCLNTLCTFLSQSSKALPYQPQSLWTLPNAAPWLFSIFPHRLILNLGLNLISPWEMGPRHPRL